MTSVGRRRRIFSKHSTSVVHTLCSSASLFNLYCKNFCKKKTAMSEPVAAVDSLSRDFLRACQKGQLEDAKRLREEHGLRDWTVLRHARTGDTGLHLAAREGHLELVQYLCADAPGPWALDAANLDSKRPLHEAAQFARAPVLDYLVRQGAQVDALKRADWTPLMLACAHRPSPEARRCVETLLEAGARPELRNKDGWGALLLACRAAGDAGDSELAVELLRRLRPERLADRSNNGRSVLHVAAFHGCEDRLLEALLQARPELLEARDSAGCTPLHEAAKSKRRRFEVAEWLLARGANVRALDNVGQTILHVAAAVGNLPLVRYLLSKGLVDPDAQDRFGITPMQIAKRNGQENVVRVLLEYQA